MADNTTKGRISTMTTPSPQADAPQEQLVSDPAPGNSPLEQAKNEAAGVLQKTWDGIKNGLGTLKDATGLGVSPEIAAGARQRTLDGAKGIAEDVAFKFGGGGSPEERAAKAQAQAAAQMDKLREAYSRNGLPGVVGALATKMVMDKVADKVMGAGKTVAGKAGDATPGPKPTSTTPQNEAPPKKTDGLVIKMKSLREQYLGRTPGKDSKTGKEVQERMRKDGKLRDGGEGPEFQASNGKWYPLKDADMAHHPKDAVSWWNETGRQYGPKSEEVRKWMLDSNNYTLDHYSLNRSAGAKSTERYLPPLKP